MATFAENRRARFDFEILETFEAGIELLGFEVKAVKNHKVSFEGSHIVVRGGEAFLINLGIAAYQPGNTPGGYDERRQRKLLLKKKELYYLAGQESQRGLTIIPISFYNNNNRVKVEIAIVRGKKSHDKRDAIKGRDIDRQTRREIEGR